MYYIFAILIFHQDQQFDQLFIQENPTQVPVINLTLYNIETIHKQIKPCPPCMYKTPLLDIALQFNFSVILYCALHLISAMEKYSTCVHKHTDLNQQIYQKATLWFLNVKLDGLMSHYCTGVNSLSIVMQPFTQCFPLPNSHLLCTNINFILPRLDLSQWTNSTNTQQTFTADLQHKHTANFHNTNTQLQMVPPVWMSGLTTQIHNYRCFHQFECHRIMLLTPFVGKCSWFNSSALCE